MVAVAKKEEPNPTQQAAMHRLANLPARSARSPRSVEAMRDREAQRVATILQRDQPPAPPKKGKGKKDVPAQPAVDPTPEWLARYAHIKDSPTTASGFKMAARPVYRKQPWFESLCGRDDAFTDDDLTALRYYRNAYEQAQRSETRCALASMVHGSGGGNGEPSLAVARAKSVLDHLEPALGSLVTTMRAIALGDLTYEQVAMAQYGYRERGYDDKANGRYIFKCEPRSGRDPGKVKAAFLAGAKLLTAAMLGRRVAANANGPSEGEMPVEGVPVHQQLSDAIYHRMGIGRPVGSIVMAEPTARAVMRELGLCIPANQPIADSGAFEDIPFSVNFEWPWGWVLNDGEVG